MDRRVWQRRRRSARGPAVSGVAAVVVLLGGSLVSASGYPGYSLGLHFVSELADPINRLASMFRACLLIGGVLMLPFVVGLGRSATNRHTQQAALAGTAAAGGTSMLGLFPFTQPVPHFVCAAVAVGGAVLATWWAGGSLRHEAQRSAEPRVARRWRWLAGLAFAAFGAEALLLAVGLVHTGWLLTRLPLGSVQQLLVSLPAHQRVQLGDGGSVCNPIAAMEWAFLFIISAVALAASVGLLTGGARPERLSGSSAD